MGDPRSRTTIPGKYPIVPLFRLLLMLVCLGLVIRTPVTTDLIGFIPKTGATEWLLEGFQTGPAAKLILIALEGGTEQAKATASRRLAKRLSSSGLLRFIRLSWRYRLDFTTRFIDASRKI